MKRLMSIFLALALALALGLCGSALAEGGGVEEPPQPEIDTGLMDLDDTVSFPVPEGTLEERLARVTAQVKKTLAVDDGYTDFSGDWSDGPVGRWDLYWSDETRRLNVEADGSGKVMNIYLWTDSGRVDRFRGFDPLFPSMGRDEALALAGDWCARLFAGEESGRIDQTRAVLGADGYWAVEGTVLKNGLPSPIRFSMDLRADGLASFDRSDSYRPYVGALPPAEPGADAEAAGESLRGALAMELYYVSDGDGGAQLQYVPCGPDTVVDAATGEAVDMQALYASFDGTYDRGNAATMDAAAAEAEGGLTAVELASIASYEAVMDQQALDDALRKMEALGLEGFEQDRCSYARDAQTGAVTATVRYTAQMTEDRLFGYSADQFDTARQDGWDLTVYKTVTLDAETGALRSVNTRYPLWERPEEEPLSAEDRIAAAADLLALAAPEMADQAALCTLSGYDTEDELIFARVHEGFFYPENYLLVSVNGATGTVDQFRYEWDEDVAFGPAEDIVTADEALAAYADALTVTLGYGAWPVGVDREEYAVYADWWGYSYVEELRLVYYYEGLDDVAGVDALTGAPVQAERSDGTYVYDDLDGAPQADMIAALGLAGVGYPGGKFLPEQALTERDAVRLLLSAAVVRPEGLDDEALYERAAQLNLAPEDARDPDAAVTRMDFLRLMIGASRYGDGARLAGIWETGFSDVDALDEGFAAVARALGLAEGDALRPAETLTRADAAALLGRFMER